MERRRFLAAAAAITGAPLLASIAQEEAQEQRSRREDKRGGEIKLGGYSLSQLRELYRRDLFTDWLPFMDRYVIDGEYGGFLCNTNFDGAHANTEKDALFEGDRKSTRLNSSHIPL